MSCVLAIIKGLSHLGVIYASRCAMVCNTPHGDVGTDMRSRAAPQNFVIHKIFMHHLRDAQMKPKWDRPLIVLFSSFCFLF